MSFVPQDKEHVESLRISKELVGPIYPVIKSDLSGRIVAGEHRLSSDHAWPITTRHFDNEFDEEIFRIESNTQRTVSEEEQKLRFQHLAEACVRDKQVKPNEVSRYLLKALKGRYTERWIHHLLEDQYKLETAPKKTEVTSVSVELLNDTKEKADKLKGAIDDLAEGLHVEDKTYGIGQGCLCSGCPRKDECY
jgi:hypothetical protein